MEKSCCARDSRCGSQNMVELVPQTQPRIQTFSLEFTPKQTTCWVDMVRAQAEEGAALRENLFFFFFFVLRSLFSQALDHKLWSDCVCVCVCITPSCWWKYGFCRSTKLALRGRPAGQSGWRSPWELPMDSGGGWSQQNHGTQAVHASLWPWGWWPKD